MTYLIHQPHARETAAEIARQRVLNIAVTRELTRRHAARLQSHAERTQRLLKSRAAAVGAAMISRETATRIAQAHAEIEAAETLLGELRECADRQTKAKPDPRHGFGLRPACASASSSACASTAACAATTSRRRWRSP